MTTSLCNTQAITQLLEDKCESIVWINNHYIDPVVLTDIKLFITKNASELSQLTDPKSLFKESIERYVTARNARDIRTVITTKTNDDIELRLFFDELDAKIDNAYFRELFILSKFNPVNLFVVHFLVFIASQLISGAVQEYIYGDTSLRISDLFMVVLFAVSYLISLIKLVRYETFFVSNIR